LDDTKNPVSNEDQLSNLASLTNDNTKFDPFESHDQKSKMMEYMGTIRVNHTIGPVTVVHTKIFTVNMRALTEVKKDMYEQHRVATFSDAVMVKSWTYNSFAMNKNFMMGAVNFNDQITFDDENTASCVQDLLTNEKDGDCKQTSFKDSEARQRRILVQSTTLNDYTNRL